MKSLFLAALLMFDVEVLTPKRMELMKRTSWHEGCPVPLTDLRLLKITYLDYSGKPATGELIVHRDLAEETESIFRKLYEHRFQIEKMMPVDEYGGNDDRSMEANNTSAFNCRDKTGQPGSFSNHSWGRAIDINPLTNPYVKGNTVLPAAGRVYLNRRKAYRGGIQANDFVVKLFQEHGWTWGGGWKDRQDYQHFEKPN
jgi:D-alanyl-D-alanine carboxypeptidase